MLRIAADVVEAASGRISSMHEPDHGLAARRAYEELPHGKPAGV
jgi:hypothetical protein